MRILRHLKRRATLMRGQRRRSFVVAIVAGAAFIAVVPSVASAATCSNPDARPVSVGSGRNAFTAVAMAARCDAWAVGSFEKGGASQTLTERWNGTRWRHVTSPNPAGLSNGDSLNGVATTSSADAWAVGWYIKGGSGQTLTEHWNGTQWKHVPSPNPGGLRHRDSLKGVSATSAGDAWAVGFYGNGSALQTLILHWDGIRWTRVPSRNPGGASNDDVLTGVAARSPRDVWAVGWFYNGKAQRTLIEHWDGTRWTRVPSPNRDSPLNILNGVTATTASDAWAVGYFLNGRLMQRTLVERWNGTRWVRQPSPNRTGDAASDVLFGVAASSATNAWAVGYSGCCVYQTLTLHWNGTAWSIRASGNPGGASNDNVFKGVAARPRSRPWAVGYILTDTTTRPLALRCC
jgi:hypothetical protein